MLPQLWIPVTVVAHLFAAVWLVRAFQLIQPAAWSRIRALLKQANDQQASKPGSQPCSIWPEVVTGDQYQPTGSSSSLSSAGNSHSRTCSAGRDAHSPCLYYSAAEMEAGHDTDSNSEHHAMAVVCAAELPLAGTGSNTLMEKQVHLIKQSASLRLTWRSIGCTYKTADGVKPVLYDVWGEAVAGEMQVRRPT